MSSRDILSDDEDSQSEGGGLVINKQYAQKLEREGRRMDLLKARQIDLDDDEDDDGSESEDEDDDAELLSSNLELQIINTINSLRKRDPKIYDSGTVWFENADTEDEDDRDTSVVSKKKRYKDVLREQLINEGSGAELEAEGFKDLSNTKSKSRLLYDKEQEDIRKQFIKSMNGLEDESESDDFLQVREKSAAELEKEKEDILKALDEMKVLGKKSMNVTTSENQPVDVDQFLTDYIVKQKWKDSSSFTMKDSDKHEANEDPAADDEDDEAEIEAAEEFESKYNFRFEELQGENGPGLDDLQVVGHARNISGSLRRVDDKRKLQRQLQKERKEKEKRQKEEEMKRLKNLKRQELQERLKKISEIGGLNELGIDETVLDKEWDPAEHDALMAKQYGDDYYGYDEGEFDAKDAEINEWLLQGNDYDDEEFEEEKTERNNKSKSKNKKKGKDIDIEELLHQNPSKASKSMLDELYQLDYEDIVAGIPCRFKYKEVEPEDFGLTTEEILLADDNELNSVVSLKRLSAYNDRELTQAERQKISKRRKKLRQAIKDRNKEDEAEIVINEIAEQDFVPTHASDLSDSGAPEELSTGKKKRKRHKHKTDTSDVEVTKDVEKSQNIVEIEDVAAKKRKKKYHEKKENPVQKRLGLYN